MEVIILDVMNKNLIKLRKKSWIMQTNIYKYLMKKYNKRPNLDLGSGLFFEDVDYAIDFYEDSVKGYCKFIKHDLNIKPYSLNKKFKTITCWRVIEYIKNRDVLISEAYRLLDDDGCFIISLGDTDKYGRWVSGNKLSLKSYALTSDELKNMLKIHGFNVRQYFNSIFNFNHRLLQPLWKRLNGKITYFVCTKTAYKILN